MSLLGWIPRLIGMYKYIYRYIGSKYTLGIGCDEINIDRAL
jgi:hypothetical protein